MSAEPIHTCPDENCQGPVKRLIGEGAGIIFKGHGFYCTDYKNPTPPSGGQHHHHHTETKSEAPKAAKSEPAMASSASASAADSSK